MDQTRLFLAPKSFLKISRTRIFEIYNKFSIEVIENYFSNKKQTKQNPRTYLQRPGTRNRWRLPPLVTGRSSLGNRPEILRNTICVARYMTKWLCFRGEEIFNWRICIKRVSASKHAYCTRRFANLVETFSLMYREGYYAQRVTKLEINCACVLNFYVDQNCYS